MSNNKAFVRYANNKAVPGSLIVRKKAPSVGVWKEVSYDLCCGGGSCNVPLSNTIVTTTLPEYPISFIYFILSGCPGGLIFQSESVPTIETPPITGQDLADFLNTSYPFLGNFTYTAPNQMSLQLISNLIFSELCTNPALWTMTIDNAA
jgi:hypothetical protein